MGKKWTEQPNRHANRRRYRAKKQAYIGAFKADRGCAHCGESDPVVLELHHRNPDEKVRNNLSMKTDRGRQKRTMWIELGYDKLNTELAKCDVLCANCHRRLTIKDKHYLVEGYHVFAA